MSGTSVPTIEARAEIGWVCGGEPGRDRNREHVGC
jgi:hypothetical protein